jgi:hypothetical protein
MVGDLVSKLWDEELKAADLRNEGNRYPFPSLHFLNYLEI